MAWRAYKEVNKIAKNIQNKDKLKLRLAAYFNQLKVDEKYKD